MKTEMEALRSQMKGDTESIWEETTKSFSAVWKEVESSKAKNKHLEEQVACALKENYQLKKEVETLKDRVVK